jgi:thiol-disulfide isomerase/thioredoxin
MVSRRREIWLVLAVAIAFALLSLPRERRLEVPRLPELAAAEAAAPAPPFELARPDGSRTSLAEHAGRVVLLHFWATWCAPCRRELPALEALRATLEPEGLALLAVSVDAGSAEAVARFAAARAPGLDVLLDPGEDVARRYGAFAYPTSVVIDRTGRIVHRAAGAFAWDAPESVAWFRSLLAAPPQ